MEQSHRIGRYEPYCCMAAYLDGAERIWNDEKQRHQVWECSGVDADGNHGRLKLLGTVPDTVTKSMSDPDTLQSFIDYGVANYPAEKYDLICWDHGGGPAGGFALDNLDGAKMILLGNVRTGEEEIEVDLCEPIPLTEEEGRGLSISRKPISRIRELDADKVLAAGKVCDIYSYEYDITEKLREADEKSS